MYIFITILILLASILMILAVLVQKSKGAAWQVVFHRRTRSWVYGRRQISWRNLPGLWQLLSYY